MRSLRKILAIFLEIQQGRGLIFYRKDRTVEVNKEFIYMALFITEINPTGINLSYPVSPLASVCQNADHDD